MTAINDAEKRIESRWKNSTHRSIITATDAVAVVSLAVFIHTDAAAVTSDTTPVPTEQDLLDALSLIRAAHRDIDHDERLLIQYARAAGITWERIGSALGYSERGARQGAQGRAKKLGVRD